MGQAFEALWGLPTSRQVAKYGSLKGQEAEEEAKESLFFKQATLNATGWLTAEEYPSFFPFLSPACPVSA